MPQLPASLTVHVEADGAPKSGSGARHASPGQTLVVTLGLSAPGHGAPTASFFGGAASPMSPAGGGGSLWRSSHAITDATPEGTAVFRVSAGGTEYTPASITSGGNIVVDTTAPGAPRAEFTGSRSVVLEFGEPPLPESVASSFTVTPAGDVAQRAATLHSPGSPRVVLDLATAVGAGTHTVTIPAALTDMAGNAYAGGAVTARNEHTSAAAPTFSVDSASIRPLASGTEVAIDFSQGVMGSTAASEWELGFYDGSAQVNTAAVTALSAGSAPGTKLTLTGKTTRIVLHTAVPAPQGATALDVRYSPDAENGNRLEGESELMRRGQSAQGERTGFGGSPEAGAARFVDDRTVRLSLDRPLERSGDTLPFVDAGKRPHQGGFLKFRGAVTLGLSPTLGDTVVEYARGSDEVTLHSSEPARQSAVHHVVIPPQGTRTFPHAAIRGEGYSGALLPSGRLDASNTRTDAPAILYAYADSTTDRFTIAFTGPLDGASLEGAQFSISAPQPSGNVYRDHAYTPGSVLLVLSASTGLDAGTEYTATIPVSIRGEGGALVAGRLQASATASAAPILGITSAEFKGPNELEVRLSRPIDPAHAGHVTVSGLGAVTQHYEPRSTTVTLRTEDAATGGTPYTVSLLNGIRDYAGTTHAGTTRAITYMAPSDTAPPSVTMARTVSGAMDMDMDRIRVHFDEELPSPPTSGFAVKRVGTTAEITATHSYVGPADGGPRVDLALGSHELLEGARYAVTVPPVSDGTNMSEQATVEVERSQAPASLGAEFTAPNSLRLDVSEPLDPSTVGGIGVIGLGETAVEYTRGSTFVTLRTVGAAVDGARHEIRVPPTVADEGGTRFSDDGSGGPLRTTAVPVAYDDETAPEATRAELRSSTTTAVVFDEDVTFADASRPDLRAAHWTVSASPGGDLGVSSVGLPARTVLIVTGLTELTPSDSGRTLVLTHGPAPPHSNVRVSYEPGNDGGDVTDTASPANRLGAFSEGASDATPPSFTARTLTASSTLVEFTRPLGGFTAASDWAVDGSGATRISRVGPADAPDATRVFVPQGTGSIVLEHAATAGPASTPRVSYGATDSAALRAGTERLEELSTQASDGIAPTARAEFVGRQVILLAFTEPLDTATVAAGAFSVTADGGQANLLAAQNAVTHHAGSPVVILRLAAAAQSEHTVTVAPSVTDANGVAYATPAPPITATPPQGAPAAPFTARTDSISQTTVTFAPAVSGMTSASEWTVDGMPATGIVVGSQGSSSATSPVTLAAGTGSITLSHRPLGSTAATPAVSYSPGTSPLRAGGVPLAPHTAIAADGAGPDVVRATAVSRTATEVTFREAVEFRGKDPADRAAKWDVTDGSQLAVSSVDIKPGTQGHTITITHAKNSGPSATPTVRYTPTGDGSLRDAAGNGAVVRDGLRASDGVAPTAFGAFAPPAGGNAPHRALVWVDEEVMWEDLPARHAVPLSVDPRRGMGYYGLPALAMASEDGSHVPVYLRSVGVGSGKVTDDPRARGALGAPPKSLLTLVFYEEPAAGSPYTLTIPPALSDAAGNALEASLRLVRGTDADGPVLERAAFTGPGSLYAEFDEPLLPDSVAAGSFAVTAESGGNLLASVGQYAEHSRRVTLNLSAEAVEGTAYMVAATADLQDARGNAHEPGNPAAATYDATPPTASGVAFADRYTLEVPVSEPLDVGTVRSIGASGRGFEIFDIEYKAGSKTVTLNTLSLRGAGNAAYPEVRVTIPDSVTDANGVAFRPTTLFTAHGDKEPPAPHMAATLSPASTLVRFDPVTDRIRFGEDSTPALRAAHWSVAETHGTDSTDDDTELDVTDAHVAEDWHSLLLVHSPSSGAGAQLSVRYLDTRVGRAGKPRLGGAGRPRSRQRAHSHRHHQADLWRKGGWPGRDRGGLCRAG